MTDRDRWQGCAGPDRPALAVELVAKYGTISGAAEAVGLGRNAFRDQYRAGVAKGAEGKPHQKPVPEGHVLKGVSTFIDRDGNIRGQWVKTRQDEISPADLIEAFNAAAESVWAAPVTVEAPARCDADLLTLYGIADLHLGMFAWGRETGGADYDLGIASGLLRGVLRRLIAMSPASATGVVLWMGDALHADNPMNRTERSGHPLDVDTRYAKVVEVAIGLMIESVAMALIKHARVIVRVLPGNHDPNSMILLSIALRLHFASEPRVTVDTDPGLFWWHRHGTTLLGAHHGHAVKPADMPKVMAAARPKDWGATDFRYNFLGHVHHASKGGEGGAARWETLGTIAAKDAWHASKGYASIRTMESFTFDLAGGCIGSSAVNLPPLAVAA